MSKKELHYQPLKYIEYKKQPQSSQPWDKLISSLSKKDQEVLVATIYAGAFVGFVCGVITTIIFNWLCR